MMIGNGLWATTRDEESCRLYLAEIEMQRKLDDEREVLRAPWRRAYSALYRVA